MVSVFPLTKTANALWEARWLLGMLCMSLVRAYSCKGRRILEPGAESARFPMCVDAVLRIIGSLCPKLGPA